MANTPNHPNFNGRVLAAIALVLAAGIVAAWQAGWFAGPVPVPALVETPFAEEFGPADDPRLTYPTSFRNVRPEVKYVGDAACAACHREIAESYSQHPMGRSLGPMDSAAVPGPRYGAADGNPFRADGAAFSVERSGNRTVHRQRFLDDRGRAFVEANADIAYVIGSGTRTFSYLIEREGCLFESPITWYSQKGKWGLSPGFGGDFGLFERPAKPACLFCHSNAVDAIDLTSNRYRPPIFQGTTIGCERCHGPGELHVREAARDAPVAAGDLTIVNPKRLSPLLRDAVCEQCHLQGEARIGRRGRGVFDFRPGLPLHLFLSIYVPERQSPTELNFVSHVEQLKASRCSQATEGGIACTLCHDPHSYPPLEQRTLRYRAACTKCHGEAGCRLPAADRAAQGNACTACHMPRTPSADIAHTAITNHLIQRRPNIGKPRDPRPAAAPGVPIVPFHRQNDLSPAEREYDLGLALLALPPKKFGLQDTDAARLAMPLLDRALQRWPEDRAVREGRANARALHGRFAEALADTEFVLARWPASEVSLLQASRFCETLNRPQEALGYADRALAVNPTSSFAHVARARLYATRNEWSRAAAECRIVLRWNPAHVRTRSLLIFALASSGEKGLARAEYETLMSLKPPDAERIRAIFDPMLR